MSELADPAIVQFPLRGEWTVERTPAHRVPSHGTNLLGMRYAYDFIRTDGRAGSRVHPAGLMRWLLMGGRTKDCYGWGEPVHAVLDGEVVGVLDGVSERQWLHPVREYWSALRMALTFNRDRESIDTDRVAGNHVIVGSDECFSMYAHLAPDSLAVEAGQWVSAGDVIGRVGHSGNSTSPHLHFQLMDSADVRRARGIPCAFSEYFEQQRGSSRLVRHGVPQRQARLRVE